MTAVIAQMQAIITANTSGFDAGMKRADASLGQFEKGTEKATKATSRFGGALQVFAGNVLTQVASRLLDAGKSALRFAADSADAASDIAESTSKVGVLLGAAGKQATDFAETSAKSFGVSKSAALDYVGIFANLMTATGQARSESAKYSVQLVKTAADLASFNNTSIDDALNALQSGLVGESEPLRRFGVQLSAAAIEAEVMGLGLSKSTKEITAQQKQLAILSIIKRQTAAASGDFARTADGAANSTRVLSARFEDLKAKVGEVTLPIKIRLIKIINEFFDVLDRNKGKIKVFFQGVGEKIQDAVDTGKALLTVFNSLPDSVQQSASSVAKLVAGFAPLAVVASNVAGLILNFKQLRGVQAGVADVSTSVGDQLRRAEERMAQVAAANPRMAQKTLEVNGEKRSFLVESAGVTKIGEAGQAAIKAETEVAKQGIRQAAQTAGAAARASGGMVAGQFAAAGAGVQAAFGAVTTALAPFVLTIGIVVAALAAAAVAFGYAKTQIAKAEIAIARAEKPAITVVPLSKEEAAYKKARQANPKLPANPKLDASIAAKDEDRRNQLRNVARTGANNNVDSAKSEIEKLKTKISTLEQDLSGEIENRDKNAPRLKAIIDSGRDQNGRGSAAGALARLNDAVKPLDDARAELAKQQSILKVNEASVGKLDKGDKKRLNDTAYTQGVNDKRRQVAADAKASADAAAKAAAEEAKQAAEAARKAREAQFTSLLGDVKSQRTKLKQLTAANKRELQSANMGELAQKFDKIDIKSGAVGKLAQEYLRLAAAIKKAEGAAADKARVTSALAGLYDTVRTKVLLLRDSTIENSVSIEIFKRSYTGLTEAEKDRIKGIVALQKEEKGLSEAQEAATKKAEEKRAAQERLSDSLKTASLNLSMYRASVEGLDDSANPAILALQQTEKSFFRLDFATQLNIVSQALFNQKLLDGKGLEAHKKRITDLVNQYQSLIHAGSEWSKFLIAREGSDFEAGIDPEKLRRLREEFVALGNVEQAGGLERLRDRIKEMKIATGELKFPTTEARLAYEQFGKKVEELSPEIAAEVRKTAKEFDRLAEKIKKIEMIKQVGATIKDVFNNAFTTVLQTGKGFFSSLIDGFKQAIIRILAEKAAAAVASGAEDLLGTIFKTKSKDGDKKDDNKGKGAGSTYSAMSQALEDAKRTPTPVTIINATAVGQAQAGQLSGVISNIFRQGGGVPGMPGGGGAGGYGGSAQTQAWDAAATQVFGEKGADYVSYYQMADAASGGALHEGINQGIKEIFSGFKFASGGRPPIGKASLVGERGAELFVPNQSGTILTHEASRKILEGGGGTVEQINYNGPITINDKADLARIKAWNRQKTQKKLRLV